VTVVVIGGTQAHVEHYRTRAQALAVAPLIRWAGPRPVPALQQYLQQADILLSPRIKGGNTPLKIYSYMLAGKVILATDISSHTQVLDAACAYLAAPEPQAVAQALQALSANPDLRRRLGQTARQRALDRHTREAYTQTLVSAYSNLKPRRGRE
jgi:glycosyltransferase involved in cell wall biosynthesis